MKRVQGPGSRVRCLVRGIFLFFCWSLAPGTWPLAHADSDISAVERPFLEGQYDKACRAAQDMIDQRSRQRYELYYLKGLSELKLNKFRDARESFQNIISRYPGSNRVFDAYLGIGDSYMAEGNTQEAVNIYNDVMARFPKDKNIALVKDRLASKAIHAVPDLKPNVVPRSESKGYISVQAGCFKNRRNAESLSRKLAGRGYESYVELPTGSGDKLYRVKVGRLDSQVEADAIAAKLRRDGYKTKICNSSE